MGRWDVDLKNEQEIFGLSLLPKLRALIKWLAMEFRLTSDHFSIHSLRLGGASNLYASGIDLDVIRRFGRWRSATFHL